MAVNVKELQSRMLTFRAKNNYSMVEAAKVAGISSATWRYIEQGLKEAKPVTLYRIDYILEKNGI